MLNEWHYRTGEKLKVNSRANPRLTSDLKADRAHFRPSLESRWKVKGLLSLNIYPISGSLPWLLGFPCGSVSKESVCNARDHVRFMGWEEPLEEGKVTHSSTVAWKIPWTAWFMESQRVGHDWATFTFTMSLGRFSRENTYKWRACYTWIVFLANSKLSCLISAPFP